MHQLKRRALEKRAKNVSSGTFYIFATDRESRASSIVQRSLIECALSPHRPGRHARTSPDREDNRDQRDQEHARQELEKGKFDFTISLLLFLPYCS